MSDTRRKRDPYTRFACKLCKRRKIKCSGELPCTVCVSHGVDCVYEQCRRRKRSTSKPRQPTRQVPEQQSVEDGRSQSSQTEGSRHSQARSPATSTDTQPQPRPLPGSSGYYLHLADQLHTKSTLSRPPTKAHHGLTNLAELLDQACHAQVNNTAGDFNVIHSLGFTNCLRITTVYEDEIGAMYPFLDLTALRNQAAEVYQSRSHPHSTRKHTSDVNSTMVLVFAIVAMLLAPDSADKTERLTKETRRDISCVTSIDPMTYVDIELLMLMSIYHFMTDREVLAWRNIGAALRLLQELGYHNSTSLQQQCPALVERQKAKRLLWCAYTLDRRWSFGTGLPFGIAESSIDYDMDIPVGHHNILCQEHFTTSFAERTLLIFQDDSTSSMYLKSMVTYCHIATECRNSITGGQSMQDTAGSRFMQDGTGTNDDFSEFRIQEWSRRLPPQLQFHPTGWQLYLETEPRSQCRMRLLLFLRASQMRIVIRRQAMFKCTTPEAETASIQTMVQFAQDTVRVLSLVAETCDLYQSQQRTFNHFLETAVSSLLVAIARCKGLEDTASVNSVKTAMRLIESLAGESAVMRRLYDRLASLKIVQVILQAESPAAPNDTTSTTHPDAVRSTNAEIPDSNGSSSMPRHIPETPQQSQYPPGAGPPLQPTSMMTVPSAPQTLPAGLNAGAQTFDVAPGTEAGNVPDSFPYVYFADLQSMLDMDTNTFTF